VSPEPGGDGRAELERLAERAVAGDRAAMGEVYRVLAPRVTAYCRLRGVEDPEALTQEVFLRLVATAGDVTGGWNGLRAFTYSVAHGRCVDEHRRRGRRPGQDPYDAGSDPRAEVSTEERVLAREGSRELLDVIGLLPDDQRSVIVLRVVADLPVRETAQVIGISEAMVKKLQATALSNLRGFLAPEDAAPRTAASE
jgi:RNA polymerase sigma-70 factor (ECF subfamily)